ncbi:hypothetical protein WKI68_30970 [Streptomyces sp. MS1.HAVA.3]|uniref:Uncharacterized protein n=1 Tax=Streptomyces caledonius TaxID=3134107 RepID=A0ABU8U9G7_9ACTN
MQIIAVILAAVTAAATSIAYIRNASAGSPEQPIPLLFLRLSHVPLWVDLVCYPAWFASALLLAFTLPPWAAMTVYCLAAVLPWELIRRHHNRRVKAGTPA